MVQLKLIKGLSYSGIITATAKKPFVTTDDETAKKAVETGYFAVVENIGGELPVGNIQNPNVTTVEGSGASKEDGKKSFDKMTKAELEAYAAENGIDISQCTNNKQKIELINKAAAEKLTAALSLDEEEEDPDNESTT